MSGDRIYYLSTTIVMSLFCIAFGTWAVYYSLLHPTFTDVACLSVVFIVFSWNVGGCWMRFIEDKFLYKIKGRKISEIDPYGEENWED